MQLVVAIAHVLGGLLMVFAATFTVPIVWSLVVADGVHGVFIATGLACLLIGLALWLSTAKHHREVRAREGCLLVVLAWVTVAAVATVPLMWTIKGLSFTDAYFETMSGLTTTGSTVLVGLDDLPQSINIWRHALQWFGGMGIIVLAVAILPMLGVGGMQLFKAETPGPMKDAKITPRVTQTAKYLWLIYAALTLLCILMLRIAGLSWFDAVCHAFSALSLGGFSTRDSSVLFFDSPAMEFILGLFMMLAVLNFTTHFLAFRERSLKVYWRDAEVLAVWSLILGSGVMLAAFLLWKGVYPDFLTAWRYAAFNVISIATSSGYMSTDYDKWPIFAPMWMLFLCCVSSSAGSTGGGIKMIRALILLKQAKYELVRMVHPRAVTPLCVSGQVIDNRVILSVLGYMLLYGVTVTILCFALMATGLDFVSSVSGVIASINNTGPGLNVLGPAQNFQALSDLQTWLCIFAMLAGRLELLTVFVLFTPHFWRK
jgi:trk system potassium uptake protein